MNKLEFEFHCLDGDYQLLCEFGRFLFYMTQTNIDGFESIESSLDMEETKKFIDYIEKSKIETWENDYTNNDIEDACTWSITFNDKKIIGSETHEPYYYEYFLKALSMLEKNSKYFELG